MKALGKGSVASIVKVALTICWVGLWVALSCIIVGLLAYGTFVVLVAAGVVDGPIPILGETNIQIDGERIDLTYENLGGATWPVVVPGLIIAAVVVSGGLIVVDRLRRLFETFTSAEPFRRENADHLRVIWITLLVVEVSRYVLLGAMGAVIAAFGAPDRATTDFDIKIDLSNWMSILVLIVLAEVFREGARLKEEQELTI